MGYLLTAGVLGFQVAIFLSILGAGSLGRDKLLLVTGGWIAFTLFGSIFTAGLLLLQLVTIFVSYNVGNAVAKQGSATRQPKIQPQPAAIQSNGENQSSGLGLFETFLLIAGTLLVAHLIFGNKTSSTTRSSSQTSPIQTAETPTSKPSKDEAIPARAATGISRSKANTEASDLRHCLDKRTNKEIAQCTERSQQ